jgi:AraC-like DNA-binding protein
MFVGPFRPEKEKISHFECLIQKKRTTGLLKLESRKHLLKEISFCEIKLIRNLALALSLMMGEILDNMEPLYSANLSRRGKIEMYIKREFRSTVSLEDLANFMCLSTSRISQLLKEYFNKGFAELLNEQRLGQSEKLLANSYFTIETIARECGFRDSSYFFRVFKTKFGISPGAYRKLKQKERFPEKLIC